ncbi:MAG: dockerin type I domain-containing protein [Patescibacteria group bacterium]
MRNRFLIILSLVCVLSLVVTLKTLNDFLSEDISFTRLFLSQVSPGPNQALYFVSPSSGTHNVNSTFQVQLRMGVSAGGTVVCGGTSHPAGVTSMEADLSYNPALIQVSSMQTSLTTFSTWWEDTFDNVKGKLQFQASTPCPGFTGNNGLIATITFQVMGAGAATLTYDPSSLALKSDDTNILSIPGSTPGSYTLVVPDTTPPSRSNGAPAGTLAAGTTSTTLSLDTNENATCRYSTTQNTAYAAMVNTFSTTGGTTHSTNVTGLSNGQSYNYYVRCQDVPGNPNTGDFPIEFSVDSPAPSPDTTPPSRSGGSPSGTLGVGTTQATLQLTTDEAATCRYSTTQNTAYAAMTNTFSTTGSTSHSTTVSGLSNGNNFSYYVRCQDGASNPNITDFPIEFSVASPPASTPPSSGGGGGGGGPSGPPPAGALKGDCNGDARVNIFDLSVLISNWKKATSTCDLNGDRTITIVDLSIMLSNWTK